MIDYDRIAADYVRHRRVHPQVLLHLLSSRELRATSRVLDVGCGTGNYIIALKQAAGCACWGTDPSAQMLAQARRRGQGISFEQGRAEKLEFPNRFFDLVFSVDVIHHVSDRPAFFREAHRVLRKQGQVCTVTDSEWIIRHRRPLTAYFAETVKVELQRYPRTADLREMMMEAGFGKIAETTVEFSYTLRDIQAYRDKAFSSLHLIPEAAFQHGIARMEEDLRRSPIPCTSYYLLLWGTRSD